ncbi:glycosyltransferase family 1 protein [Cadophora sp. DSE1049]|nr:glycosyltransferase family 1 protein [Cadophora sp. DSE1049]
MSGKGKGWASDSGDQGMSSSAGDNSINWDEPPPYETVLRGGSGDISAKITDDGRLDVCVNAKAANTSILPPTPPSYSYSQEALIADYPNKPPLNIVIQIVGSRGDVQPFIALGQELQANGHRIRIATHGNFKDFVESSKLEFFSIGGDPAGLMAYMVKNPSIMPTFDTLRSGDIGRKRKMIYTMLNGCWESCIMPDETTGIPFVADAIIANPPSFAHVHCAQALSVPLHLMFTMPWSPTRAFPHPLANIQNGNADPRTANYLSYGLVDLMTWQGLSDVINLWRKKALDLEPVPAAAGPGLAEALKIPFTYCWSPALIPKPQDWPQHIDVCGFFFREETPYTPDTELAEFLKAGPKPIYIGFGSIVMEDPVKTTDVILEAVRSCNVRAIVSRGWSKLGADRSDPNVLFIGDCPHEWLFKNVSAVVHHGGAGTTACGLLNGRPTSIVPFFGDQPFWANMVAAAGAGPRPIAYKALDSAKLSAAIRLCLAPETAGAAASISARMKDECGVKEAAKSFYRNLPLEAMSCDLLERHNAVWLWHKKNSNVLKLSDRAAFILLKQKKIDAKDLALFKARPIVIENPRWDPLTATSSALLGTVVDFSTALWNTVADPYRAYKAAPGDAARPTIGSTSLSVGYNMGKVGGTVTKATLVDVPLALTDGLHNVPKLYGEKVRDQGAVTDWKSGGAVAGKSFGYGFYDGITGIVTQPMEGAKKDGALGFAKGLAKGSIGLVTKPGAAMFGLLAYPAMGLYKSMNEHGLSPAQTRVLKGRQMLSAYVNEKLPLQEAEIRRVVDLFEMKKKGR